MTTLERIEQAKRFARRRAAIRKLSPCQRQHLINKCAEYVRECPDDWLVTLSIDNFAAELQSRGNVVRL